MSTSAKGHAVFWLDMISMANLELSPEWLLFGTLCASSAAKLVVTLRCYRRRPADAVLVGKVSELWIYPVKSCQGISGQRARITDSGINFPECRQLRDRQFMLCRPNYHMVSQRHFGKMVFIRPSYNGNSVELEAPGMDTLRLPVPSSGPVVDCCVFDNYLRGVDCGDAAAKWVTSYIGEELRVVYTSPDVDSRGVPELGVTKWHRNTSQHHKIGFPDMAPYLLLSESSLKDLNTRLEKPVPMKRFRPNIVAENIVPYDEDEWREVYIGEEGVKLINLQPCGRCVLPTVDPETGIRDPKSQPLAALNTYRRDPEFDKEAPCFGVYLFPELTGNVKVGDPIYAVRGKRVIPPGPVYPPKR